VQVGHSWGGVLVQYFAAHYPDKIAGLVLVDPTDPSLRKEEHIAALESIGSGEAGYEALMSAAEQSFAQAPSGVRAEIEVIRSFQEGPEAHVPGPLPNVPVTTLLAARSPPPPPIELPFSYRDYFEAILRHRVNHFSTSVLGLRHGTLVLTTDVGHFIHADDPHLVVEAVRRVVELAGEHQ
jgi:pimeloyl-ACP methyl ester carboxylesterase